MGQGTLGLDLVLFIPGTELKVGLFDEGVGVVTGRECAKGTDLTARLGLITLNIFVQRQTGVFRQTDHTRLLTILPTQKTFS